MPYMDQYRSINFNGCPHGLFYYICMDQFLYVGIQIDFEFTFLMSFVFCYPSLAGILDQTHKQRPLNLVPVLHIEVICQRIL